MNELRRSPKMQNGVKTHMKSTIIVKGVQDQRLKLISLCEDARMNENHCRMSEGALTSHFHPASLIPCCTFYLIDPSCTTQHAFLFCFVLMVNLPGERLLGFYDHSGLIPIFVMDLGFVSRLVSGSYLHYNYALERGRRG